MFFKSELSGIVGHGRLIIIKSLASNQPLSHGVVDEQFCESALQFITALYSAAKFPSL